MRAALRLRRLDADAYRSTGVARAERGITSPGPRETPFQRDLLGLAGGWP
jgi:hypothetical protein